MPSSSSLCKLLSSPELMDVKHDEELELAAAGALGRLDALLRAGPSWRDDVAGRRDELRKERDVESGSPCAEPFLDGGGVESARLADPSADSLCLQFDSMNAARWSRRCLLERLGPQQSWCPSARAVSVGARDVCGWHRSTSPHSVCNQTSLPCSQRSGR